MKIVAGTLEGFLYGFEHSDDATAPASTALPMSYGYHVHSGCVKSVAVATAGPQAGKLLVTGGADERVRIYDLGVRCERGELQQHSGTVTALAFHGSTHMLSGSEDKTICIWRVHDWALLHVLGGHKGTVTGLDIHPSGRLALSVSSDRTLRLWNLLEGRAAYIKRLPGGGDAVKWSPQGTHFAVAAGAALLVYEVGGADSEPLCTRTHPLKINGMAWVGDGAIATAADDRVIRVFSKNGDVLADIPAEATCGGRVRELAYVADAADAPPAGGGTTGRLVTATSSGGLQVWAVKLEDAKCALSVVAHTKVLGEPRFTCLAACAPPAAGAAGGKKASKKRKRAAASTAPNGTSAADAAGGDASGDVSQGEEGPAAAAPAAKQRKAKHAQPQQGAAAGKGKAGGGRDAGGGGAGAAATTTGKKRGKHASPSSPASAAHKTPQASGRKERQASGGGSKTPGRGANSASGGGRGSGGGGKSVGFAEQTPRGKPKRGKLAKGSPAPAAAMRQAHAQAQEHAAKASGGSGGKGRKKGARK